MFQKNKQAFIAVNNSLNKMMPLLTPLGVILALFFYDFFAPAQALVVWFFAFLTFISSMNVSLKDFKKIFEKPKAFFAYFLSSYILLPFLVFFISSIVFNKNPETITGFILLYTIPTAVTSSIWTVIHKGNLALTLTILVISVAISPITTPLAIKLFATSSIIIDTSGLIVSLVQMVLIPTFLGLCVNYFSKGKCSDTISPYLAPFGKVALLFVIIINISQIAGDLINDVNISYIPKIGFAFIFSSIGYLTSFALSKLFKLEETLMVSVVLASSLKNISAALVLAIQFFPPEASIPVISGILLQNVTCAFISPILFKNKKEKK